MKIRTLAEKVGLRILTEPEKNFNVEIHRVCAGDNISNLLNEASEVTLLVTNLSNALLPRVAGLMDVPGLCLLNGHTPEPELLRTAKEHGTLVMVSPYGMFETCGRIYQCLAEEGKAAK